MISYKRLLFWSCILAFLLFCYFLGVSIRLKPVERSGVYLTGDDPLIHFRNTLSVVRTGDLIRNDSLAWQPRGIDWKRVLPNFHYYLGAGVYRLVKAFGVSIPHPSDPHGVLPDEVDVYSFCVFFPAFFAPLIVFPLFFLGRVLWDWRAGAVASFLIAVSPGYLSRTTAGFYRHEQIALPLMISALLFFFLAVRARSLRRCVVYSFVGGVFFVLTAGTWAGFKFLMAAFPVAVFVVLLVRRADFRLVTAYSIFVSMGVLSFFVWHHLLVDGFDMVFAFPLVSVVVLLVYWFRLRDLDFFLSLRVF